MVIKRAKGKATFLHFPKTKAAKRQMLRANDSALRSSPVYVPARLARRLPARPQPRPKPAPLLPNSQWPQPRRAAQRPGFKSLLLPPEQTQTSLPPCQYTKYAEVLFLLYPRSFPSRLLPESRKKHTTYKDRGIFFCVEGEKETYHRHILPLLALLWLQIALIKQQG